MQCSVEHILGKVALDNQDLQFLAKFLLISFSTSSNLKGEEKGRASYPFIHCISGQFCNFKRGNLI